MTPQLVDFNADGTNDLIMATFEGTAFFVEGTDEGFKPPLHIVDRNDSNVRISMYYDMEENEYRNVDRSSEEEPNNEEHHMTSIAVVDWDNDGDQDLLLGAYEGALYLCLNEGTDKEPKFAATNLQVKAAGEHLTIANGLATPRICDWNGDGLFDILCGGSKGGVYYYQNTGKPGAPVFAAAETLISKTLKDSDSGDYYASMTVPSTDGVPDCPGTSFHFDAVDYDGDGDLDLLVGAQSYCKPVEKELTDEEQKELDEIREKMEALQTKMMAAYEDKDQEELEKLFESEEFSKMQEEISELHQRSEELSPSPNAANFIWLYRNRGNSTSSDRISANVKPTFSSNEFGVQASFDPPTAATGDEVTLTVVVHVPDGFHVYGSKNSMSPTQLVITDAGGLGQEATAVVPSGRMVVNSGKPAWWLEGLFTLKQVMVVPKDFESVTIQGHIAYTMCDEQYCQPPAKQQFTATLQPSK